MTVSRLIEQIREEHEQCCVTTNCRDHNCRLGLRGLDAQMMVIINGTSYQKAHPGKGKLCDRLILSGEHGGFVCSIELKGGRSQPSLPPIVEQIQAGFDLANCLLSGHSPSSWYPILAFSGHTGTNTSTAFRARSNMIRIPEEIAEISRTRCETELATLLTN